MRASKLTRGLLVRPSHRLLPTGSQMRANFASNSFFAPVTGLPYSHSQQSQASPRPRPAHQPSCPTRPTRRLLKPGSRFSLLAISTAKGLSLSPIDQWDRHSVIPLIGKGCLSNIERYRMLWAYADEFASCDRRTAKSKLALVEIVAVRGRLRIASAVGGIAFRSQQLKKAAWRAAAESGCQV
jgi:hypothetical protein